MTEIAEPQTTMRTGEAGGSSRALVDERLQHRRELGLCRSRSTVGCRADGNFTFTVNSLECGTTTVGQSPFAEEAQGQFCLLAVRVENTGQEAGTLSASDQYLLDASGTQYSASSSASFANDPEGGGFFSQINPGNAVESVIVFDVPADATITQAELHDSFLSGGVAVDVSG